MEVSLADRIVLLCRSTQPTTHATWKIWCPFCVKLVRSREVNQQWRTIQPLQKIKRAVCCFQYIDNSTVLVVVPTFLCIAFISTVSFHYKNINTNTNIARWSRIWLTSKSWSWKSFGPTSANSCFNYSISPWLSFRHSWFGRGSCFLPRRVYKVKCGYAMHRTAPHAPVLVVLPLFSDNFDCFSSRVCWLSDCLCCLCLYLLLYCFTTLLLLLL